MTDFFNKKCEVVRDLLPIYADHGTSPETTSLIAQHISKCESCSRYLGYIRKSNAKKRDEIKSEINPDYLRFLNAVKRRRKFGNAIVLSSMLISAASISAAIVRFNSYRKNK